MSSPATRSLLPVAPRGDGIDGLRTGAPADTRVAVLTGGDDPHYSSGLATALADCGVAVDYVGSDALDRPDLRRHPRIRFLNLRGDQSEDAPAAAKVLRLTRYYARLVLYAVRAEPRLFHVLWNNRVEWFDRTLLMLWYRLWGRRVVLTAHNVNRARRDGGDSMLNRLTLRCQYRLCERIFVHTRKMQDELVSDFGVERERAVIIPFGVNDAAPRTTLDREEARRRLGISADRPTMLFFGQIAPYKGLDHLLAATAEVGREIPDLLLLVAGKVKRGSEAHWSELEGRLADPDLQSRVRTTLRYIPDDEIELYFKAADVLVLPYTSIFQSAVLFLGYGFGLPVVVTDVGEFAADVVEGVTGHVCRPCDAHDLARAIRAFFDGDMYRHPERTREQVTRYAGERHSWSTVAEITVAAYRRPPGTA